MRKCIIAIIGILCLVSDTIPVQAQESDYVLVFSDEFNQKDGSQPDPEKWSRHQRGSSTWSRWISDSTDVVYIKDGCLVCRAIPNKKELPDTAQMLTGAINTKGKFEFQYGKVEVRMKTNRKQGNFPAAWLAKNNHKDQYGEIDIVEMFGQNPWASHAIHSNLTYNNPKHGQKNSFKEGINTKKWHIYGIEWTADHVIWYVDGKPVAFYHKSTDPVLLAKGQWTFDFPFYLILNQSVGNGEYGNFGNTKQTYETQFDWIRVYQKKQSTIR